MLTIDFANALQFATDEQVCLRIGNDFGQVAPDSAKLIDGKDGVITPAAPWTLTSATIDFAAVAPDPGRVVRLTAARIGSPTGIAIQKAYASEEYAAVVSASGNALTIRRLGQSPNAGQNFAPTGVVLTEIRFLVNTLDDFLRVATSEIRDELREYATDADIQANLTDARLVGLTTARAMVPLCRNRVGAAISADTGADPWRAKMQEWQKDEAKRFDEALILTRGGGAIIIA
jgi:hypothetical protein